MIFPVAVAVCLVISGCAARLSAQNASVRQVAYLKASNPTMHAHFGEGGALPRPYRQYRLHQRRWQYDCRRGAPRSQRSHGNQRQPERRFRQQRRRLYVYARNGGNWVQQAYVKASNAVSGDYFGSSVDLSADGNTLAVAAHWEASAARGINGDQTDNAIPQAGAVYIFTRSGGRWTQQAYIKSSNTGEKLAGEGEALVGGGDGDQSA